MPAPTTPVYDPLWPFPVVVGGYPPPAPETPVNPEIEVVLMRKLFVECKTRQAASKLMPWACAIVKVDGGYLGFESSEDYQVWKNQK